MDITTRKTEISIGLTNFCRLEEKPTEIKEARAVDESYYDNFCWPWQPIEVTLTSVV
jgi:hypothetical protein